MSERKRTRRAWDDAEVQRERETRQSMSRSHEREEDEQRWDSGKDDNAACVWTRCMLVGITSTIVSPRDGAREIVAQRQDPHVNQVVCCCCCRHLVKKWTAGQARLAAHPSGSSPAHPPSTPPHCDPTIFPSFLAKALATCALNPTPNIPNFHSLLVARYSSNPPFFSIVLKALPVVLTSMVRPNSSLLNFFVWTFGLKVRFVFCLESEVEWPDCNVAPS